MENVVIIGSGPAGYTAAIYAARANLNPIIYTGALPGGLLTQTTDVENFPGFPEAINGFELVYKMQEQAEKFGARIEMCKVEKVDFSTLPHKVYLDDGQEITAKAVIIATGATPRWLEIPSEDSYKNRGISACATCDGAFYRGKKVIVVGGGDSAMEEANFLTNFAEHVTVLVRRDVLRASKIMAERAENNPKISFLYNTQIKEFKGESKLESVTLYNSVTDSETDFAVDGVFVALGHQPATEVFSEFIEIDEHGFIKLIGNSTHTNIMGVFAAGDCADPSYRQAITAAASGCRAALDAERFLSR